MVMIDLIARQQENQAPEPPLRMVDVEHPNPVPPDELDPVARRLAHSRRAEPQEAREPQEEAQEPPPQEIDPEERRCASCGERGHLRATNANCRNYRVPPLRNVPDHMRVPDRRVKTSTTNIGLKRLKKWCKVRKTPEHLTTITCSCCDSLLVETQNPRTLRCTTICKVHWNRDINAAINIRRIWLHMNANQGQRPHPFVRPNDRF